MPDENTHTQAPAVDGGTRTFGSPDGTGTFTPTAPADAQPVPVIPGYEVLESVGCGGMGRVFRARQLVTDRVVAVKLILAGEFAGGTARERFRIEIETTAKLSHPHIVQLYEAGEADGRAFLVCEFVAGGSLAARLDGTPWEAKRAALLLVPLVQAVAHAHATNIVHRDLKPANILLTTDGQAKVADFGIAKRLDADFTNTGAVMGTPSYMPPEQAGSAQAVGAGADVYSLGAILYELLTGRPPFKGADFVETIDLVRTQEPVPPRVLQPRVPRDIETVCLKCLQKDPAKRYPSADALADDLTRFLESRPIVARPVGAIERGWRWTKRNPAVASLLAAVLLVFATGTGVASFFAVAATTERKIAAQREHEAKISAEHAETREREANDERRKSDGLLDTTEELLYAAHISQGHTAALEYRTERLIQLLGTVRPQPGRPDRRRWEWHYLDRLARSWDTERNLNTSAIDAAQLRLDGIANTSLTSDGKRVLVTTWHLVDGANQNSDGIVRAGDTYDQRGGGIFDAATGRFICLFPKVEVETGTDWKIWTFCPEGKFAALTESLMRLRELPSGVVGPPAEVVRYRVRVFNVETGEMLTQFPDLEVHPAVCVSRGGNRVVLSLNPTQPAQRLVFDRENYPRLEVWDRGSGNLVRRVIRSDVNKKPLHVGAVSADGKTALVFSARAPGKGLPSGDRWEFWNIADEPVLIAHAPSGGAFGGAVFSPDGHTVAISEGVAFPRVVGMYDARTGQRTESWQVPTEISGNNFDGLKMRISDGGERIALAGEDGLIHIAERTGESRQKLGITPGPKEYYWRSSVLRGSPLSHPSATLILNYVLAPDGRRLSAVEGLTVRTWDLTSLPEYAATWPISQRPLQMNRLGLYVRNASEPGGGGQQSQRLTVYDTRQQRTVREFQVAWGGRVTGEVSPDGRYVLLRCSAPPKTANAPQSSSRFSLRKLDDPTREIVGRDDIPISARFSETGRWVILEPDPWEVTVVESRPNPTATIWRTSDGRATTVPIDGVLVGTWVAPDGRFVIVTRPPVKEQPPTTLQGTYLIRLTFRCYDPETGKALWDWSPPEPFSLSEGVSIGVAQTDPGTTATIPIPTGGGNLDYLIVMAPPYFFSADGQRLGIVQNELEDARKVWVVDMATGARERELAVPSVKRETALIDPGGAAFVPASRGAFGAGGHVAVWVGREVVIWDDQKPSPIHQSSGQDPKPLAVVFSNDGTRLFTLDSNGGRDRDKGEVRTLRVWELARGRELLTIRLPTEPLRRSGGDRWANEMWMEGERLMLRTRSGVRVFDGTPRKE